LEESNDARMIGCRGGEVKPEARTGRTALHGQGDPVNRRWLRRSCTGTALHRRC